MPHIMVMYSPHEPSPGHLERLRAAHPDARVTVAASEDHAVATAPQVDVVFGHRYLRQCLPHARRLRWVQTTTSGVDRLPVEDLRARRITLTRFTGSAAVIARHAVTLAWALVRGLPYCRDHQHARRWEKNVPLLPFPRSALVLGMGAIGREIARLLSLDGLHVTGVRRHTCDGPEPFFDGVLDARQWRAALPGTDLCFVALPLTADTVGMVDETCLRALPPHAVVVNVGRGETLALEALVRVLEEGHLGGAALDVLPEALEPLDAAHPLWTVPRLFLTPHVAAYDPGRRAQVERFCEDQLARYLRGEPLLDVVPSDRPACAGPHECP